MRRQSFWVHVTVAFSLIASVVHTLPAQNPASAHERPPKRGYASVTATIALVDELPEPSAQAYVLRRADQFPRDVILLRQRDASSGRLAAAITSLLVARQRHGEVTDVNATIFVGDSVPPAGWKPLETTRADRVLANARAATPQKVDGVGDVRAAQVSLGVVRVIDRGRQGPNGQ